MASKLTTFLWFDANAEDAVAFYKSVFPKVKVGERMMGPDGKPITVPFELFGQPFVALNGGPQYKPTPAVSFAIACATQAEIDRYWEKLSRGGEPMMCGWVADKFGMTWQIVPRQLPDWLQDKDAEKAARVTQAMLKMRKFDVAKLRAARAGK